jgi:hypothetical protein
MIEGYTHMFLLLLFHARKAWLTRLGDCRNKKEKCITEITL